MRTLARYVWVKLSVIKRSSLLAMRPVLLNPKRFLVYRIRDLIVYVRHTMPVHTQYNDNVLYAFRLSSKLSASNLKYSIILSL